MNFFILVKSLTKLINFLFQSVILIIFLDTFIIAIKQLHDS